VHKILHTEWSNGWGGQEIRIIDEIMAISEFGHDVFLACRKESKIYRAALEKNIRVFTLPFRGNFDLKTIYLLIRIIKENNISIVNTHSGKDTWVGGLAAKICKIKFIRTRHLSNAINSSRLNFINQMADYIFTTGESVRLNMINHNRIKPEKIKSIPTGIDTDIFNPSNFNSLEIRRKNGFTSDQLIIGIVAVLRGFKRHDRFLRMAGEIIRSNPQKKIIFLIVGDGPQKNNIKELLDKLNLNDKVILYGHSTNVPQILSMLDIFVLSSDSGEGVPQSIMQALLMKKAVIATDAGSTIDLHDGKNFLLVNKDSEDELFDACKRVIHDRKLRKNLSEKSRDFIYKKFSRKVMVEKINNIYKII